jgi:hypothetical protein
MKGFELDERKAAAPSLSGVVDAILKVGRQRAALLTEIKGALERGDNDRVLVLCRQLCGVTNGEEGTRTNPRIN